MLLAAPEGYHNALVELHELDLLAAPLLAPSGVGPLLSAETCMCPAAGRCAAAAVLQLFIFQAMVWLSHDGIVLGSILISFTTYCGMSIAVHVIRMLGLYRTAELVCNPLDLVQSDSCVW